MLLSSLPEIGNVRSASLILKWKFVFMYPQFDVYVAIPAAVEIIAKVFVRGE